MFANERECFSRIRTQYGCGEAMRLRGELVVKVALGPTYVIMTIWTQTNLVSFLTMWYITYDFILSLCSGCLKIRSYFSLQTFSLSVWHHGMKGSGNKTSWNRILAYEKLLVQLLWLLKPKLFYSIYNNISLLHLGVLFIFFYLFVCFVCFLHLFFISPPKTGILWINY